MTVNLGIIGKKLEPSVFEYSEKDVILYALGVGCGREDLQFVYENGLQVLPTFAVVPAFPALFVMGSAVDVSPMMILHGEQRIELHAPIPPSGRLTTTPVVTGIFDKVKGALVVIETETVDATGKLLFKNVFGAFARGAGGFGGDRGPSGLAQRGAGSPARRDERDEDAAAAGASLSAFRGHEPAARRSPRSPRWAASRRRSSTGSARSATSAARSSASSATATPHASRTSKPASSGVVYPGETIVTEMWREGNRVLVQARTKERGESVINNAAATVA